MKKRVGEREGVCVGERERTSCAGVANCFALHDMPVYLLCEVVEVCLRVCPVVCVCLCDCVSVVPSPPQNARPSSPVAELRHTQQSPELTFIESHAQ